VLVQFRLDDKGKPQDARVVFAEPKDTFERTVLADVIRLRFKVPPEWAATNPDRSLQLAYVFRIEGCTSISGEAFPGIDTVVVSTRPPGGKCPPASAVAPQSRQP
jgi:hypothetical protein